MWTVERACMLGMQSSDIYSERIDIAWAGAAAGSLVVRCSARPRTCVLCVSNSRQLAYPGLSYRPIRYRHHAINRYRAFARNRDPGAAGRRERSGPASRGGPAGTAVTAVWAPGDPSDPFTNRRVDSIDRWTSTSASPRSPLSQHAPSRERLGQSRSRRHAALND